MNICVSKYKTVSFENVPSLSLEEYAAYIFKLLGSLPGKEVVVHRLNDGSVRIVGNLGEV